MSFLLGLVLISRRLRDLVFVITGFTLGHSLTLGLAVTGVLRPHAEYIDALVALTIALIGTENIAVATRRPEIAAAQDPGGLLLVMSFWFGSRVSGQLPVLLLLEHGPFQQQLPDDIRPSAGRRTLTHDRHGGLRPYPWFWIRGRSYRAAIAGGPLGGAAGRLQPRRRDRPAYARSFRDLVRDGVVTEVKLSLPRPIVVDVSSAFLAGLGFFWFVSRSF